MKRESVRSGSRSEIDTRCCCPSLFICPHRPTQDLDSSGPDTERPTRAAPMEMTPDEQRRAAALLSTPDQRRSMSAPMPTTGIPPQPAVFVAAPAAAEPVGVSQVTIHLGATSEPEGQPASSGVGGELS